MPGVAHGAMSSANLGGAPSRALHGSAHCGASAVESLPETADEIAERVRQLGFAAPVGA